METRYVGTFGGGHCDKYGASLAGSFVFFAALSPVTAHNWMVARFGHTWSHLYTSPEKAGVKEFNLQQYRVEGDLLFCDFPEHVNAEEERKQAWSDPKGLLEKYGFIFEALGMEKLAKEALGVHPLLQKDLITITPEEIENNKLKKAIADLDYTLNKKKKEQEGDDEDTPF